jgi:hypothetical protein
MDHGGRPCEGSGGRGYNYGRPPSKLINNKNKLGKITNSRVRGKRIERNALSPTLRYNSFPFDLRECCIFHECPIHSCPIKVLSKGIDLFVDQLERRQLSKTVQFEILTITRLERNEKTFPRIPNECALYCILRTVESTGHLSIEHKNADG